MLFKISLTAFILTALALGYYDGYLALGFVLSGACALEFGKSEGICITSQVEKAIEGETYELDK